jgi:hypothetical protein
VEGENRGKATAVIGGSGMGQGGVRWRRSRGAGMATRGWRSAGSGPGAAETGGRGRCGAQAGEEGGGSLASQWGPVAVRGRENGARGPSPKE